ncbi:MAG: phenylacetate--CoA ligase family protein [Minwuia sp.]|uniref:phenylacetate--CoA ligase family protein n=1 Tax=Minwuia sp. TaxID=2493630 RepID=UPI003A863670
MTDVTAGMLHPEIEQLDRDDMLALQNRKLAALGDRLAASPEWVEHFRQAGLKPQDLADRQALDALPFLEKAQLRERYPFPMLGTDPAKVEKFCATSGTTGLPVLFGYTADDMHVLLAKQVARQLHCHGVRPGDRGYNGFGFGLWVGGLAYDLGMAELGMTNFPVGPGRSDLVAEWMRDMQFTLATVSPVFLATLIRTAREKGIDPKRDWKLRHAVIGGQSVSRAFRDELEAELPEGFMTFNTYGTTEAGGPIVATTCPHSHGRDEMHLINEDTVLTEILDPETFKPVGPGEIGEIVVTTLDKQASPVVRWRTRDLVRVAEKPFDCPCGRKGMGAIGRIIGRSDDMLKVRGVIVYPSQIEDVVAATPGTVKEAWQIYVDQPGSAPKQLSVAIESETGYNGSPEALADSVASSLTSRLGLKVPVECHAEGALPRYEAKAQRVLVRN